MTLTLNIIGGGKLGQTLGHLWHQKGLFNIGQIMCTCKPNAEQAVEFVGAGHGIFRYNELTEADIWLIATPDSHISSTAARLVREAPVAKGNLAFHCSGALPSTELSPLKHEGLSVASIHPVHSFSQPTQSINTFGGSACAYEGDDEALKTLLPAFKALDTTLLAINSEAKSLYHTGSVLACNYLVPLLEASLKCLQAAQLSRDDAAKLLSPLVHATVDNVLQGSATDALTGPIARGDAKIVSSQLQALLEKQPGLLPLYQTLGIQAVNIARQQRSAQISDLDTIESLLNSNNASPKN